MAVIRMGRKQRTGPEAEAGRGDIDGTGIDPGVERDAGTDQEVAKGIGTDAETRIVKKEGLEVAVANVGTGDIEAEVRTGIEGG